jgi:hypothetical protein
LIVFVASGNRKEDAVARLTHREKLALVLKRLTETPNEAEREVILRRLAEEVAKDALKLHQSQLRRPSFK